MRGPGADRRWGAGFLARGPASADASGQEPSSSGGCHVSHTRLIPPRGAAACGCGIRGGESGNQAAAVSAAVSPAVTGPADHGPCRQLSGALVEGVVGRDRELAAVGEFLDGLPAGLGVLLIEGGPGIGKTTVWLAGRDRACRLGHRVLSCRPIQTETPL